MNQNSIWILLIGAILCLAGLFLPLSDSVAAEDPNKPAASQDTASEETSPGASENQQTSDPNSPAADDESGNEDDIFELNPDSLNLINEAYSRIFTPDLVTDDGRVKYSILKRKRWDVLDAERELKELNPAILMSLKKEQRIAFWINTYNFCTIKLILDHYPIKPKWFMIIYPDNSIMQITGAWEKEYFEIQQLEYNLREIEQDFLLERYKDPRICFALSNASMGGAPLRNEPYQGDKLDQQLNDQVSSYLKTRKGMRLDKDANILYLSNLFQMHKDTFLDSEYAKVKKFRDRKKEERAWLNFILPYLSEEDARYLDENNPDIKFIDFDWHLNEIE